MCIWKWFIWFFILLNKNCLALVNTQLSRFKSSEYNQNAITIKKYFFLIEHIKVGIFTDYPQFILTSYYRLFTTYTLAASFGSTKSWNRVVNDEEYYLLCHFNK